MIRKLFLFLGVLFYSLPAAAKYPYKPFACDVTVRLVDYGQYVDEKDKKTHALAKLELVKVNMEYTAINVQENLYGAKKSCADFNAGEILKISDFEDKDKLPKIEQGITLNGTLSLIKSNPKLGYRFYNIEYIAEKENIK